ncbi:MAG: serine/threonine-protein kinase [Nannocystaceae bacterium]
MDVLGQQTARAAAGSRGLRASSEAGAIECEETLDAGVGALRTADDSRPAPDERVGRFIVLERLGAGAMGVVYAAWDPQLERRVAIKLLLPPAVSDDEPRRQARLLREARALAKLAHPNIVGVYEAGIIDGRVFLAMEYVEGETLRARLERVASTRALLDLFLQAGRGLAAAHGAGIVHRDFKPENVLVGEDGRVRVVDFGLARALEARADAPVDAGPGAPPIASSMTATGAIMGTPAYLSPEGLTGREVGPAADQFGFCVAAWEAFHGRRPFAGRSVGALLRAIESGEVEPARPRIPLPGHVRRALLRGLRAESGQRWPSMNALLEALADDPRRRLRGALALAGVALMALVIFVGQRLFDHRARVQAQARCEDEASRVDVVWNDDARARLRANLSASGAHNVELLLAKTAPLLEGTAERWRAARYEACLDDDALGPARAACLDEELSRVTALLDSTEALESASAQRVVRAAVSLAARRPCEDDQALRQRATRYAAVDPAEVVAAHRRVGEIEALLELGDHEGARRRAAQLVVTLERRERPSLAAEAHRALGRSWEELQRGAEAVESYERAYTLAVEGGDDELAAAVAARLLWVESSLRGDDARAGLWARLARASDRRLGRRAPSAKVLAGEGMIDVHRGDFEAARGRFTAAVASAEAEFGREHPEYSDALNNLAIAVELGGDHAGARALYRRSLAIQEQLYGREHPQLSEVLNNLGQLEEAAGALDEAEALYQRALANQQRSVGTEGMVTAVSLSNLSYVAKARCQLDRALEYAAQSLTLRRASLPADHPHIIDALTEQGVLLVDLGRFREALRAVR